MEWSHEKALEFLDLYREESLIWDPTHRLYNNKGKVHEAWARISSNLNTTIDEIKTKKNSMMATFRNYRRKKEAAIRSGIESHDIQAPVWFAYKKMEEFLGPVYHPIWTSTTDDSDVYYQNDKEELGTASISKKNANVNREKRRRQLEEHCESDEEGPGIREISTSTGFRAKRRKLATEIDYAAEEIKETIATLNNVVNKISAKDVDDCELYGRLLVKKLRYYNTRERQIIMHEIDGILLQKPPSNTQILAFIPHSPSSTPPDINDNTSGSIKTLSEPSSSSTYNNYDSLNA